MTPEAVRVWQGIFRDVVITCVAAFMLIYDTVFKETPNLYVIGAGLTMLGIPPALRLDQARRSGKENGNEGK